MAKYKLYYGLGGGFGGARNYEIEECENEEKAEEMAWELACGEYENYSGLHGLRSIDEIIEEDEVDEEEAEEIYCDERESWLDYWVELVEE